MKQAEKFNWALLDENGSQDWDWEQLTEEEALSKASHYIKGSEEEDEYTLCKMLPVYRLNTLPPDKPKTTVTCLATGETTTITL